MKTAEDGFRRGSWFVALCALGAVAFVFFAISCGSGGQSGSRTEQATVTTRESTVTDEQSPTNVAPDRPVVDVEPVGSPSLVARLRQEVIGPVGLDADGDFVAWIDAFCAVHFVRLSDNRQALVPYWDEDCNQDGPGDLALLGSRAVWSVVGAGLSSAHATVSTAAFGDAKQRDLGSGEGQCESDYCPFRTPIIDSSGGSLVYQLQDDVSDDPGAGVWRSVSGGFKKVPVHAGPGLAVHGKRIVVVDDKGVVQLRRLRDGSLIRRWGPVPHPPGETALSDSLLVISSRGRYNEFEWIDLYETATGRLAASIPAPSTGVLSPQPFADGVVFFAGRTLRYVDRGGKTSTLATARRDPVSFALSGRRAFWIEYGASPTSQRLYLLNVRATARS